MIGFSENKHKLSILLSRVPKAVNREVRIVADLERSVRTVSPRKANL